MPAYDNTNLAVSKLNNDIYNGRSRCLLSPSSSSTHMDLEQRPSSDTRIRIYVFYEDVVRNVFRKSADSQLVVYCPSRPQTHAT